MRTATAGLHPTAHEKDTLHLVQPSWRFQDAGSLLTRRSG
jgi:hypothetical protein